MTVIPQPAKRRVWIGRWVGILISLALLVWVLRAFDLAEVVRALQAANYLYLLPVLVLIVLNFSLRALRWGTLFGDAKVPCWSSLFVAMMIGYLANNILPARAGELVRAYVLGQREGAAKSTVLATVVVERVADLMVALLLLAAVLLFYPLPAWLGRVGIVVGAVGLAALAFLALLNLWGLPLVTWIVHLLRFLPKNLLRQIEAVGSGFVAGVSGLRNGRRALRFLGYTVLIWLMEVATTFLIARAFDLPVTVGGSLFVMLVVALGTMVPSSPAYIGTYEFFGANALALLGVTGGKSLSFVLMMHAVTFAGASLIGALCLAFQKFESILPWPRKPMLCDDWQITER